MKSDTQITDITCREYKKTNPLREHYSFRCAGFGYSSYMFAWNITKGDIEHKFISMPLLDETQAEFNNDLNVDFLPNGLLRIRNYYGNGGQLLYEIYDFSKGGESLIPVAQYLGNAAIANAILIEEAPSSFYQLMKS